MGTVYCDAESKVKPASVYNGQVVHVTVDFLVSWNIHFIYVSSIYVSGVDKKMMFIQQIC